MRDEDETVRVFFVPGQVLELPVPVELWEVPGELERHLRGMRDDLGPPAWWTDPAQLDLLTDYLVVKMGRLPWYEKPVPAWIFLSVLVVTFIALVAAILWPLGIQI